VVAYTRTIRLTVLVRLGQALEGVAREDLLSRAGICPRCRSTERSPKGARRTAFEHAELDDIPGNAVRESHRELEDVVVDRAA
jgi:hypothetical protein